jgi:hypothetical protein
MESPGRQNEAAGLKGIAVNAAARTKRQTVKQRSASTRAAARINRRGEATLTTHCVAAGLTPRAARSVAGSLRNTAKHLDITGRAHDMQVKWRTHSRKTGLVTARLYTPAEVAVMAARYAPRVAAYKTARNYLMLAA